MTRSDYIEQYSVKVTYTFQGSGVLVKSNTQCYLFTAKHNFKKKTRETHKKVIVENIDLNLIKVNKDNIQIQVYKIVFDKDDLIVFLLDSDNPYIKSLEILEVLEEPPTDDIDYFFHGYPAHKPSGHSIDKLRSKSSTNDELIFTLRNIDENKTSYIEGFSGSGVFLENENTSSFTRTVFPPNESSSTLNIFDLSKVIDSINSDLSIYSLEEILIQHIDGEMTTTNQMYKIILNRNPNSRLVKKVINTFGDSKLDELQYNLELDRFVKNMNISELKKLEQKYRRELADLYLLGSFISTKNDNNKKAENFLLKSIEYKKEFKRYYKNLEECKNIYLDLPKNLVEIEDDNNFSSIRSFFNFIFFLGFIFILFKIFME